MSDIERATSDRVVSSIQSYARSFTRSVAWPVLPIEELEERRISSPRRVRLAEKLSIPDSSTKVDVYHVHVNGDYSPHTPLSDDEDQSSPTATETTSLLAEKLSSSLRRARKNHSTFAQTVFNTTNLILGVAILGIPLAFKRAGLICGLLILTVSAVTTLWTARLIGRCLKHDRKIRSYTDLAYAAFGPCGRLVVTTLVAIELTASSVAQTILFADGIATIFRESESLDAMFKIICGVAFISLSYAPLRLLGLSSALSVLCFFMIITIMVIVGLARPDNPGSLQSPSKVTLLPADYTSMCKSIGMILGAWGGHTVFPELYHDMREPSRFYESVKTTYAITYPLYVLVGVVGYLMFGNDITGPITSEIISLPKSPKFVAILVVVLVTVCPIAKVPLNIRPLSSALEQALRSKASPAKRPSNTAQGSNSSIASKQKYLTPTLRTLIGATFVGLAICLPSLDKAISLMGVVAGLLIAVVLPITFYLSILRSKTTTVEKGSCVSVIIVSAALAVLSLRATFS